MQTDYTHVSILRDRSGSMADIKSDIIGGFNNFIEEQKKVPGKYTITLAQFDHDEQVFKYDAVYNMVDVTDVKPLTHESFQPRGMTPLFDAAGMIINKTGNALSGMNESNRPAKVLIAIITDGLENASEEYSGNRVREMVKHQEEKYNWKFIYIGANQDAFKTGQSMGMKGTNYRASKIGTQAAFYAFSTSNTKYRTGGHSGDFILNDEDILSAEEKLKKT